MLFNNFIYEMSNYGPNTTGLMSGTMMWVRTEPGGLPHTKFRFKLEHPQKGSAVLGFWGDEIQQVAGDWKLSPAEISQVQKFTLLNKDAVIAHINGELDSSELGATLASNKTKI